MFSQTSEGNLLYRDVVLVIRRGKSEKARFN